MTQSLVKNSFRQPVNLSLYKRLAFLQNICHSFCSHDDYSSTKTPLLLSIFQCCCNIPCHALLFISVPEAVWLINTTVQSDTSLIISWRESHKPNGPKESVRYQLAISHMALIPKTPLRRSEYPNGRLSLLVTRLSGGKLYVLKVQ